MEPELTELLEDASTSSACAPASASAAGAPATAAASSAAASLGAAAAAAAFSPPSLNACRKRISACQEVARH